MTKLGVSRFRDFIKEKQAVPRQGLMRVHFVTLKEKQAVRRQRVHFVTLKMKQAVREIKLGASRFRDSREENQAVRRQSLERVPFVTLTVNQAVRRKAWSESFP
jgi:hypothetical protein